MLITDYKEVFGILAKLRSLAQLCMQIIFPTFTYPNCLHMQIFRPSPKSITPFAYNDKFLPSGVCYYYSIH